MSLWSNDTAKIRRAKAVIFLADTQIRKYTNHLCEGFFCLRVFVRVFGLCEIVFFGPECADARIFHTNDHFFICAPVKFYLSHK